MEASPAIPATSSPALAKKVLAGIGLVTLLLTLIYVYWHDPLEGNSWYLKCSFHELTGLNCPGCGGTRAMHALLHGHLAQAWWFNPFAVLIAPVLIVVITYHCVRILRDKPATNSATRWRAGWIWLLAILLTLFWIGRNLPGYPLGP